MWMCTLKYHVEKLCTLGIPNHVYVRFVYAVMATRFKLAHTTPSKPHMVINILILKEEAGESTQKVDHVLKNFQQGFETLVVVVGITLKVFCLFAQQWQQQNSSPLYSSSYWLLIMQLEYWRPSCSASHHYETVLIVDGVWGRAESATLVLSCK